MRSDFGSEREAMIDASSVPSPVLVAFRVFLRLTVKTSQIGIRMGIRVFEEARGRAKDALRRLTSETGN